MSSESLWHFQQVKFPRQHSCHNPHFEMCKPAAPASPDAQAESQLRVSRPIELELAAIVLH